jgi:hypothetical protein
MDTQRPAAISRIAQLERDSTISEVSADLCYMNRNSQPLSDFVYEPADSQPQHNCDARSVLDSAHAALDLPSIPPEAPLAKASKCAASSYLA